MDAILLAAGKGTRMERTQPKQFIKIAGKPMFVYALEALRKSPHVETIIVACDPIHMDQYREIAENYNLREIRFVEGGNTRQESVRNALGQVTTPEVMIHEAARPLVSTEFIDEVIGQYTDDGVIPTMPVTFSIVEGTSFIEKPLDRSRLHNVQLPQVFDTKKIVSAHEQAKAEGFQTTEDGMLLFRYGGKVKLIKGRESNIKITTPLDIEIVEKLLKLA